MNIDFQYLYPTTTHHLREVSDRDKVSISCVSLDKYKKGMVLHLQLSFYNNNTI